jgi:[ribosomal protein S18]-alanine N-acetyltransferase
MVSEIPGFPLIRIEPMTGEDIGEIIEIEKESFSSPSSVLLWRKELEIGMARNLVARVHHGGGVEVVGYLNFWVVAGELQLNSIAVKGPWRRSGIGARLMAAMMSMGAQEGMDAATLEVRSSNQAAIKLYEKFGFVIKGLRRGYYDDTGEDALIMWARIEK